MAKPPSKPVWDSSLWRSLQEPVANSLARFQQLPERADAIAEQTFPDSARDSSTKNAFRHALGTGMLAQELGGGILGSAVAKGVGYAWEGLGAWGRRNSPSGQMDSLHDLNANAIGAEVARQAQSPEALVAALKRRAQASVVSQPPGFFQPSSGRLTRTVM